MDTSPVGVVVLDAETGSPVSFNREAGRMINVLREPDQSLTEFLEMATVRWADGRELSLADFPPGPGADGERDGAVGGGHPRGARRTERRHAGQRHPHPLG